MFCERWLEKLKLAQKNDNDVEQERDELNNLFKSVQQYSLHASDFIFNSKQIHFIENQDPIESSLVGNLDIASNRLKTISVNDISEISHKLSLYKKTLLDVNQFEDSEFLCSTSIIYDFPEDEYIEYVEDLEDVEDFCFVFSFSIIDRFYDE